MIFPCLVLAITDADTIRCADDTRVRIAGINAREKDGSCLPNAPCPEMRHEQAKPLVERLLLGRTLQCRRVGTSYRRIVADCTLNGASVSCMIVRAGAANWWGEWARRNGMEGCRDR